MTAIITKEFFDNINLDEDRIISGTVSTIEVDRDGEIVIPSAFERDLEVYMKNPVLLLFHGHRTLPCGKCLELKILNDKVIGKFYISSTPLGNEVLTLINEGCLNGFSAGFVPIDFEENPPIHKIPTESLKTSMGKAIRKKYNRVELVEISLLPIPSNRNALIDRAEKGNSVAGLIVKSFDIDKYEDLDLVIKEWMDSKKYTLKSLLQWDENDHPRDESGKFTESSHVRNVLDPIRESNYYPSEVNPRYDSTNRAANQTVKRVEDTNRKLDTVIEKQDEMNGGIRKIRDNTSWKNWFVKYAIGIATAVGGYMLWKYGKKIKFKGFDEGDQKVKSLLGTIKQFLDKGKELNVDDSIEYQKIQRFYDATMKSLSSGETKGLSSLYTQDKGYFYLIAKEMTSENFDESEHPRHADGKFRKKTESSKSTDSKKLTNSAKETKASVNIDDHSPVNKDIKKPEERKYIREWVKNNKGKVLAAIGIAAFTPVIFAVVKMGGRLLRVLYSTTAKKPITWDRLSQAEKHAFFSNIEPGDVFLQGGKPHEGMLDFLKDGVKAGWDGGASDRFNESLVKIVNGGEYGHTAMAIGRYDDVFHQRIVDGLRGKNGKTEAKTARDFINLTHNPDKNHPEGKNFLDRLRNAEKGKDDKFFDDLKEWNTGKLLLVGGTDANDSKGLLNVFASDSPYGGYDAVGAIMRTKVPLEQREEMSQNILQAIFTRTPSDPKIKYAIGRNRTPFSKENVDIPLSKITDPITGSALTAYFKDDHMLCSGVVSELYKQYGKVDFGHNVRYVTPADLAKDKNFASMILEPKKKLDYDFNDWNKNPEDVVSGKIRSGVKTSIVGTTGVLTASAIGYHERDKIKERAEEYKKKFVKKAMSAEEFEESEHPRDADGKFTESGKSSISSPKTPKVWGGKREFSGRLPKEAHNAVPRLREKYKNQNPDASDQDIDNMVKKYAEDNLKPDIYQFVDNPEKYWADQDQKRKDALMTKYNNAVSRGQKVSPVNNSKDIDEIQTELNTAKGEFEQEVQKTKMLKDAWDTLRDDQVEVIDKNRARLIWAAAGVASVLGLALVMRKVPDISKTRLVVIPGLGKTIKGTGDPFEIAQHNLLQFNKLVTPRHVGDIDHFTELQSANILNRWLSTAVQRLRGADEGSQWALSTGTKWQGFSSRFKLNLYKRIDTKSAMSNYVPRKGDIDISGRMLYGPVINGKAVKDAITVGPIWTNILESHGLIGVDTPIDTLKDMGIRRSIAEGSKAFDVEDERKLINYLTSRRDNGMILAQPATGKTASNLGDLTPTKDTFPQTMLQKRTKQEIERFEKESALYPGWANFLEEDVAGPVSRKTLAMLSVAGPMGAASALIFYKDIKKYLAEMKRDEKFERDQRSIADKKTFESVKGSSDTSEVARIRALALLEKEKGKNLEKAAKRDVTSTALEDKRRETRAKLVELGIRRDEEGKNKLHSFTADTMYDRLKKSGKLSSASGIKKVLTILEDKERADQLWDAIEKQEAIERDTPKKVEEYIKEQVKTSDVPEDDSKRESKGFYDLIAKAISEDLTEGNEGVSEDYPQVDFDVLIDEMANEIVDQITKISKCCRTVIDAGLPGHSDYEDINTILASLYILLKQKAGQTTDTEIEKKSLDSSRVVSSTIDANGSALVKDDKKVKNETCKICGKVVGEDDIASCENSKCPYDFIDAIEVKE